MDVHSRRQFLATVAVSGVAGLAGCDGTDDGAETAMRPNATAGRTEGMESPVQGRSPTAEELTPGETDAGDAAAGDAETATGSPAPTDGGGQTEPTDGEATTTDGGDTPTETPELDLREANVTAVEVTEEGDGTYAFDVTLYHDVRKSDTISAAQQKSSISEDDAGEDGYANWWQVETLGGERLGRRDLAHAHGTREFTRSTTVEVPADVDCVVVRGHDQTHGYGGQMAVVNLRTGQVVTNRQGAEKTTYGEAACP